MKTVVCIIGVSAMLCHGHAAIRYVDLNSSTPTPPYTDWSTAATRIQDAIDAAEPGDLVLVTNGVYETGGQLLHGALTNRIVIARPITVASVNGPAHTTIRGHQVPVVTNGDEAIRCAYLTNGATLSGFALTLGATRATGIVDETNGAGVWVETQCMLSNCIVSGNIAAGRGGGAAVMGAAVNCIFSNNVATLGGGVFVPLNTAALTNCVITDNTAVQGGGVRLENGRLMNCTIVANSADIGGGVSASIGSLFSSIVYYNTATNDENHAGSFSSLSCCLLPLPSGTSIDCFTNEPAFVDLAALNLRLTKDSLCINSGGRPSWSGFPTYRFTPEYLVPDLDGNPRVIKGTVDIGAYEFQSPESALSYHWAFDRGLAHDGSMDDTDADGDGASNLHEYRSETDPNNPTSYFRITSVSRQGSQVMVNWSPFPLIGTRYMLERSTNPAGPFILIDTNVIGSVAFDFPPPSWPEVYYRMVIAEPE